MPRLDLGERNSITIDGVEFVRKSNTMDLQQSIEDKLNELKRYAQGTQSTVNRIDNTLYRNCDVVSTEDHLAWAMLRNNRGGVLISSSPQRNGKTETYKRGIAQHTFFAQNVAINSLNLLKKRIENINRINSVPVGGIISVKMSQYTNCEEQLVLFPFYERHAIDEDLFIETAFGDYKVVGVSKEELIDGELSVLVRLQRTY
jgi:hypothetical protein